MKNKTQGKEQTQSTLETLRKNLYHHNLKTNLFTAHISVILNYALSNLICNDICGFKKCYRQIENRQHNCTKVTFLMSLMI